jgi:hypothetical protein
MINISNRYALILIVGMGVYFLKKDTIIKMVSFLCDWFGERKHKPMFYIYR